MTSKVQDPDAQLRSSVGNRCGHAADDLTQTCHVHLRPRRFEGAHRCPGGRPPPTARTAVRVRAHTRAADCAADERTRVEAAAGCGPVPSRAARHRSVLVVGSGRGDGALSPEHRPEASPAGELRRQPQRQPRRCGRVDKQRCSLAAAVVNEVDKHRQEPAAPGARCACAGRAAVGEHFAGRAVTGRHLLDIDTDDVSANVRRSKPNACARVTGTGWPGRRSAISCHTSRSRRSSQCAGSRSKPFAHQGKAEGSTRLNTGHVWDWPATRPSRPRGCPQRWRSGRRPCLLPHAPRGRRHGPSRCRSIGPVRTPALLLAASQVGWLIRRRPWP